MSAPILDRWTPEQVERALAARRPTVLSRRLAPRRAAVAAVLRFDEGEGPEVLVMKRADREGDRWSGHCSFPGGMEQAGDPSLVATAERETFEELGLVLSETARPLGALDDVRAIARGKVLPMAISPFVYVQTKPAPLVLNHEAEAAFWLPLRRVASGELDDSLTYQLGPVPMTLSCWRWEGYEIWGLTHRMITDLLRVIG
jgi:8-oxo-dGTP pyrophosphatase MutT (NUDIX family)